MPSLRAQKKPPIVVSKNMVNFDPGAKAKIDHSDEPYKTLNSSYHDYQIKQRPQSSKIKPSFAQGLKKSVMGAPPTKRGRILKYSSNNAKIPRMTKPP